MRRRGREGGKEGKRGKGKEGERGEEEGKQASLPAAAMLDIFLRLKTLIKVGAGSQIRQK